MNMKKLRPVIAGLVALAVVVGAVMVTALGGSSLPAPQRVEHIDCTQGFTAAPSKGELERISENDRFILWVNLSNGEAAVKDKRSGQTWYTNPEDRAEDGLANGFHKNALQSVLTMVYTTDQSVDMTCGSFLNCVRKGGLLYRLEEDGSAIFFFDFPNEGIAIPVRYAIEEDHFVAEILSDGILEYSTNTIKSIDLLPFFGAGGTGDEGYMLLPDGSGALIYYNNNRLTAKTYQKAFYGFDNGVSDKVSSGSAVSSVTTLSENQHLPVFGVSRNDQGFLAVVTQGAARGAVNANVARKYTLYNTVWTTYYYHTIGTAVQTQKDGTETVTNVPEKKLEDYQNFRVEFFFLEKGRNTYSDMARLYREYLVEHQGLEKRVEPGESLPLYLELYGYIKKTKSLLGIPVEQKIALTTVEDANAILDRLEGAGASGATVVKYEYWANNSYFDKLPVKAEVDSTVGSAKEMAALQERLEGSGGLYLSAELLNVYKTGNGVGKYNDVLRSVSNTAQRQYAFTLGTGTVDSRYDPWYLLRPTRITEVFADFADNMARAGYQNLALDTAGGTLYSELGSDGVGRNQMAELMGETIGMVADRSGSLMLTAANDYAAVWADHIVGAPYKASNYDLEDVSIPFYEMVFHGYISYSLSAVNLASSPADMTLRCLECGAGPLFSLAGQNVDELIGSRVDHLYSVDASNWMEYVVWQYSLLREALGPVVGSTITGHRILSRDVRAVEYENGVTVYVNYGGQAAEAEGVALAPQGYAVTRDGRLLVSGTAAGQ